MAAAIFKIPGVGRFSAARVSGLGIFAVALAGAAFSFSATFSAAFLLDDAFLLGLAFGAVAGATEGCETFGVPRAGKSSSWSAFCDLALMSLERPLSAARVLMFFFASGTEANAVFLLLVGAEEVAAAGFVGTIGNATGGV